MLYVHVIYYNSVTGK